MKITLPWPPAGSSPNGTHGHWTKKAGPGAKYKADCWVVCKANGVRPVEADAVDVTVVFCPPSRRRYDLDNALSSIKRGLDAVAEAIGVDDGQWRSMTLERGEVCKNGAVLVYITAVS